MQLTSENVKTYLNGLLTNENENFDIGVFEIDVESGNEAIGFRLEAPRIDELTKTYGSGNQIVNQNLALNIVADSMARLEHLRGIFAPMLTARDIDGIRILSVSLQVSVTQIVEDTSMLFNELGYDIQIHP